MREENKQIFFFYAFLLQYTTTFGCLEHQHWGMLMPNVRRIWHFKSQSALHQGMLNSSIANFFTILLLYKFFNQLSSKFLFPLSHYFYSLLSLPSLFLICSLLSSDPNTIHLPTSTSHIIVVHFFWWVAIQRVLWLFSFFAVTGA